MNDDAALLRCYAHEGSEAAFTELVRRNVDLVYAAALRRTAGDPHRAADVAQQVFTALARQARRLSRHAVLAAWLHTATRNAALNLMISEQRRQAREAAAQSLEPAPAGAEESLDWARLRPVLDAAIDELPETDRAVVVLRFLEHRPFAEIGTVIQVSEDAARMRADRALDKLRAALSRRGITSTAAAVGALMASQPLASAPANLAATLAARSLSLAGAGSFVTTITSLLNMKLAATATFSALVAFSAGAYFGLSRDFSAPPPPPLPTPQHSELIASLRKENLSLRAQVDHLNARLAAPSPAANPPAAAQPRLAPGRTLGEQQRAMLNNLRQIAAARDQFMLEHGRVPTSANELVGFTRYIKRYLPVDGEDYRGVSMTPGQPMTVTSAGGVTVTYDPNGPNTTRPEISPEILRAEEKNQAIRRADARVDELARKVVGAGMNAEKAYRAAHQGMYAPTLEDLIPYFATPQQGADWVEFIEANKAADAARRAR